MNPEETIQRFSLFSLAYLQSFTKIGEMVQESNYLWNLIIKTFSSPHSVNKFENFRFTAPSQTSSNSACRWIPKSSEKSRFTFRTSSASRQSLRIRLRLRWWICWTICTPVLTPPSTPTMFIRLVFFLIINQLRIKKNIIFDITLYYHNYSI